MSPTGPDEAAFIKDIVGQVETEPDAEPQPDRPKRQGPIWRLLRALLKRSDPPENS